MVVKAFYIICIIIGWLLSVVATAVLDRAPPIEYTFGKALSEVAEQGGKIDVQFTVTRTRICRNTVSRIITDSSDTSYPVSEYTFSPVTRPGQETYDRTITVPENVPPGRVYYQIRLYYYCNWFHSLGYPITIFSPRVYFQVVPKSRLEP